MEDSKTSDRRGYAAVVGATSALFGLPAYDILVAIFPSLGLGPATLSAGGFLAIFANRFGVVQILVALVLLSFSGFIGGIAVGGSDFWRNASEPQSLVARIFDTTLMGAAAVGVGSLWMVIATFGVAVLVVGFEFSSALMAAVGNLAIGAIGGFVGAVTGVIRPLRSREDPAGDSGGRTVFQKVIDVLASLPVITAAIASWIIMPGIFIWTTWVDQAAAEFVVGIGGGVFFGFWAAFGLAALAYLIGRSNNVVRAIAVLAGLPVGAICTLFGNGLCFSLGGATTGGISSMVGMFLAFFSVVVGGASGIASAPFAFFLFGQVRDEVASRRRIESAPTKSAVPELRARRLALTLIILVVASVPARFVEESGERLVNAATAGDMSTAVRAVKAGAPLDFRSMTGATPLAAAVEKERVAVALFLLDEGADPNLAGDTTLTPLHHAAKHESAEMVAALLDAGAEVDPVSFRRGTPLNVGASDLEVTRLLLEAGADPNGASPRSPLMTAMGESNNEGARLLLEFGADPSGGVTEGRYSPLRIAAVAGWNELFDDLLARGEALDWDSPDSQELLSRIVEDGHTRIAEVLLQQGVDPNPMLALHQALSNGQDTTAVVLVEHGADIMARSESGRTPLHLAAWRSCFQAAELLLEMGADVNARDEQHNTPLHFATSGIPERNDSRMIRFLVERGADFRLVNTKGQSPLMETGSYDQNFMREYEQRQKWKRFGVGDGLHSPQSQSSANGSEPQRR